MDISRDDAATWATWFRALGDPTRILILNLLATEARPMSVAEIVEAVDVGQSTVSHHLKILGDVRFLLVEREATSSWWRINDRCLDCFPTAAELVMGRLGTHAPWDQPLTCTTTPEPTSRTNRPNQPEEDTMTTARNPIHIQVQQHYAAAANIAAAGTASCCGPENTDWGTVHYDDLTEVPDAAALASLGCGNPTAVADLRAGETVLDLGSGGGIDVLLSAKRVGPTGYVYGLDMTPEMLDLARRNATEAGATNVEFVKGDIESIPLPDASVDVIISNCVINLSPDKPAVFAEMHRVLRPGGRIGVSDVVTDDHLTEAERLERGTYVGCIAGALPIGEYQTGLRDAGFVDITITPTNTVGNGVHSAIVKATKPDAG